MGVRVDYIDQETGADYGGAYVRVVAASIRLDFDKLRGEFDAQVFYSMAAATAGKARVAVRHFLLTGTDFQTVFGDPSATRAYGYLKTLNEFKGGVDA